MLIFRKGGISGEGMVGTVSPDGLKAHIEKLLSDRKVHTDALARIDATLGQVSALLNVPAPKRRGRPPGRASAASTIVSAMAAAPAGPAGKPGRRKRRRFAVSGNDSILNFIRDHRNPTTKEIKGHWDSESRGGKVDNALSKLVKDRVLVRTPIPGERGSRYSVA
jgi:hypothetical protein